MAVERTVKLESDLTSRKAEHYHGKPLLFSMDSGNKFQPIVHPKDAHKLTHFCQDNRPTKAQQFVIDTLTQSEDANMAAHDIRTGEYIRRCMKENLMTDVIIHLGDAKFAAHRIVLAKYSTYFQEQFCISERDCDLPIELEVEGISANVFEIFMRQIYEGHCKITPATVKDLSRVAKYFGVEELKEKINGYFRSLSSACNDRRGGNITRDEQESPKRFKDRHAVQLSPYKSMRESIKSSADHLAVLQRGRVSSDDPIYATALQAVIKDFRNIAKNTKFVELRVDTVCRILSSDDLDVDNEEEVFSAAKTWIQHDPSNREQHLSRVMKCVRFSSMENCDISSILSNDNFLKKNESCRQIVLKANW
jgi:hypothetical protein